MPLYIKSADSAARAMAMTTITQPVMERMKEAQRRGDTSTAQAEMAKFMKIRKESGVSIVAQLVPAVVQATLGFCSFKLLRKMADIPVPDLKDGGFLWLTDLTLPDGYLLLPAFMAISMHLLVHN